eukprot:scaffold106449_cov48-Phaeocystis_antarctica.AAC.1
MRAGRRGAPTLNPNPHPYPNQAGGDQQRALPAIATKTEGHDMQGEGCQLTGSLQISRVPGNFRISAKSDSHSFNTRVMNVRHARGHTEGGGG